MTISAAVIDIDIDTDMDISGTGSLADLHVTLEVGPVGERHPEQGEDGGLGR